MKKIKANILKRILPVFLAVMIIFNCLIPNYVHANAWEVLGGTFLQPIAFLIRGFADIVLQVLQNTFVTYDTNILDGGIYTIRYSPGIIFSGQVRGLDINFINPLPEEEQIQYETDYSNPEIIGAVKVKDENPNYSEVLEPLELDYGYDKDYLENGHEWEVSNEEIGTKHYRLSLIQTTGWIIVVVYDIDFQIEDEGTSAFKWTDDYPFLPEDEEPPIKIERVNSSLLEEFSDIGLDKEPFEENAPIGETYEWLDEETGITHKLQLNGDYNELILIQYFEKEMDEDNENGDNEKRYNISIAAQLQQTVSTWYKATRIIAIVGLITVLVYIGIRVIISSTSQDKSKYKKMLWNWLVALCMLFILHYLMAFILNIGSKLVEIFGFNIEKGKDLLMSSLRNKATNEAASLDLMSMLGTTIMYVILVVLTCVFTFQYLKRVLYMAFLTIIAPLIALTYPLDKIKDTKAQAFSMWLREYIFNTLLQPVHLLLYNVLVSSAMNIVDTNPIYGIVAICFITPAEKFLRKMFGFNKAQAVSELSSAAGGAFIMNMINKANSGGSKGGAGAGSSSASKGSRATLDRQDPLAGLKGKGSGSSASGSQAGSQTGPKGQGGGAVVPNSSGGSQGPSTPIGTSGSSRSSGGTIAPIERKRRLSRPNANKLKNSAVSIGNKALGLAGGVTLGMLGLGIGAATGNLEKAITYGMTAGAIGNAKGKNLHPINSVRNIIDKIDQYTYSDSDYLAVKEFKDFKQSEDYKMLSQKYKGKNFDLYVATMLDSGINEVKRMNKVLKNVDKGMKFEDAIGYSHLASAKGGPSDNILLDDKKFIKWMNDKNIPVSEQNVEEIRQNIIKFK